MATATERVRNLRARRRALGQCVRCRAPWRGGCGLCPDCNASQVAATRALRRARRAAGRCTGCGALPLATRQLCAFCRAKAARRRGACRA